MMFSRLLLGYLGTGQLQHRRRGPVSTDGHHVHASSRASTPPVVSFSRLPGRRDLCSLDALTACPLLVCATPTHVDNIHAILCPRGRGIWLQQLPTTAGTVFFLSFLSWPLSRAVSLVVDACSLLTSADNSPYLCAQLICPKEKVVSLHKAS
jgi:hypothetical protein